MITRRGYTLIELVVYLGLLAFLMIFVVSGIIATYRAFMSARIEQSIVVNGDEALATITRDLRKSSSINTASSVLGTSPGVLATNNKTYSLSGGRLQAQQGSTIQPLTGKNVTITNLTFYRAATTLGTELVTIRMTIRAGTGVLQRSKQYYASILLRGGY
jgi:type II secretory pathway pseudopilin PulG